MQTADCRLFTESGLPFPSLRANCKQANRGVIKANLSDIQANQNYNKILECDWLSAARFEH